MEKTALPEKFLGRMKEMLGEDFDAFLASYDETENHSLRLNSLKRGQDIRGQFTLSPISWEEDGYYYPGYERPGKDPLHEAGAYYIQEASAMLPAGYMDLRDELRVLDLCAAPGGKSSQLASAMRGRGVLVANEFVPKRAKILSENLERLGVRNAIVTNEAPDALSSRFPSYFDRILVDAPCSGEGMFRKNPEAVSEWSQENILACANRQLDILDSADIMLKDSGRLVYSTCTFSLEENEGVISAFLNSHPWYSVAPTEARFGLEHGRGEWAGGDVRVGDTLRLFPHKAKGEGHFIAVLQKVGTSADDGTSADGGDYAPAENWRADGGSAAKKRDARSTRNDRSSAAPALPAELRREFDAFLEDVFTVKPEFDSLILFGDTLCAVPKDMFSLKGLKVERVGLELGRLKSGRFVPAHAWAMAIEPHMCRSVEVGRQEAIKYLRGEALPLEAVSTAVKGWLVVSYLGYPLGWGKSDGRSVKNHYPKGLRKNLD